MSFTGKATHDGTQLATEYEDLGDIIGIVSPYETPLLDCLGDARSTAVSTIHEWVEDERTDEGGLAPRRRSNNTEVFAATVNAGVSDGPTSLGVADELAYQKQERIRELLRDLEYRVINGVSDKSSARRTMAGTIASIQTNIFQPGVGDIPDDEDGSLSESVLNAALRLIWEQPQGVVDTIVVGGKQKRQINQFTSYGRSEEGDSQYSDIVSLYESDFGVCRVVLSRWVPGDTVLLLDRGRVQVVPLVGRSFHYRQLSSSPDSETGQISGEYTLEFKNESAHGLIRGLS